jgi:hypothetical protein
MLIELEILPRDENCVIGRGYTLFPATQQKPEGISSFSYREKRKKNNKNYCVVGLGCVCVWWPSFGDWIPPSECAVDRKKELAIFSFLQFC